MQLRLRRGFAARLLGFCAGAYGALGSVQTTARADNSNPNIIPLGENESFLGNTGVGRPNDTGAVYYNPAGLAEVGGTVSLSGTVYASVSQHFDSILQVNGTNVPFDASGFNAIPTAFVGTVKLGDSVGAFSVLVPLSLQFEDHATLPVPNFLTNLVFSSSETEVWYGLSIARKLGQHFALGLSVFGIQHSQTDITGVDLVNTMGTGQTGTSILRSKSQVYGLLATLGASFLVSDKVRFGLRAQTAMAQIYGKGASYSVTRDVGPTGISSAAGEDVTGAANYGIPFDFSLGTAITPAPWLTLLGDASLQLPTSYNEFPASSNNQTVTLKTTPRINLGVEALPSPTYPLRLGFYFNPSTRSGHPGDPNFAALDFFGLTAGMGINRDHVRTSVGGFYIWSSGQRTSVPPATASFNITAVGAMLTTAYIF